MQSTASYVVFENSHVSIETDSDSDSLSGVTDIFGAMLRPQPRGCEILRLKLRSRGGKILLGDSAMETKDFDSVTAATTALFHRTIQALMRAESGLLWLHAGAAARKARAWLFLGPSRSGKSTLVTQLARNGWKFLSDEVAPINPQGRAVLPFPLLPLVRKPSPTAMEQSRFGKFRKDIFSLESIAIADKAVKISGLILPTYRAGVQAAISSASPASAVVKILNNSLNLTPYTGEQVGQVCQLVAQMPCYELIYADALDAIRLLDNTTE